MYLDCFTIVHLIFWLEWKTPRKCFQQLPSWVLAVQNASGSLFRLKKNCLEHYRNWRELFSQGGASSYLSVYPMYFLRQRQRLRKNLELFKKTNERSSVGDNKFRTQSRLCTSTRWNRSQLTERACRTPMNGTKVFHGNQENLGKTPLLSLFISPLRNFATNGRELWNDYVAFQDCLPNFVHGIHQRRSDSPVTPGRSPQGFPRTEP